MHILHVIQNIITTIKSSNISSINRQDVTSGPGVRLMRDRFSILVDAISAEMGVMLWGRNGEGVEELEGMWRVKVFSTDPLLKSE